MNYRIKKKQAKAVIDICKKIQTDSLNRELFWYRFHENRILLYKIVKKAYTDKFPIQDYLLFEIPYSDNEGCFVYFCSKEKDCGDMICFWVGHKGKAIPYKSINDVEKGDNLFPRKTCQEAVWDDFE